MLVGPCVTGFRFVTCISASCNLSRGLLMVEPVGSSLIYLDDRVASVLLHSSRRQNKNSELSYETKLGSYEAELSCLSKSSISLPREKKKSAIFGSQQTTTLDRSLVSVEWRHRLTTQLVSILSFSTWVFFFQLDSNIFLRHKFQNFDSCFFSFVNINFAKFVKNMSRDLISTHIFYCIRYILQIST